MFVTKTLNFPSQSEANKMVRVLSGKPKKFTVSVHLPAGNVLEFQTDTKPHVKFFDEDRALWLMTDQYSSGTPIMRFPDGAVLLIDENPPEVKG